MAHLISPTVLVVDDQPRFGESLKKALLNFGSIGSVFVTKLRDAADLISDERYRFDAILTDISFEEGDDPERNLYDGLDLIAFAQKTNPSVERYAYSAHIETAGYETKIAQRQLDIKKIFDKRRINIARKNAPEDAHVQPWNVVRADIFRKKIGADPSLVSELNLGSGRNLTDEGVLERVVNALRPPTVTYIQRLNNKIDVKLPIQVVCAPAPDGNVIASAPKLGILVDGVGKTPADAIDDLREIIATHWETLISAGPAEISGYAELVREQLLNHVELRKNDAA